MAVNIPLRVPHAMILVRCSCLNRYDDNLPNPRLNLRLTDGMRACQCSHAIEHAHTNGDLCRLRRYRSRGQFSTGLHLQAVHQGFGEGTTVIVACRLPLAKAAASDGALN